MINKIKLLTATSVLSLLSACGGGGSGGMPMQRLQKTALQRQKQGDYTVKRV